MVFLAGGVVLGVFVLVGGLALLAPLLYPLGAYATARAALARLLLARREARTPPGAAA
ncbi:hypothetical protein ACFVXC_23785 [Streptomyces sp. NPDC058257]|uniref:hypothetical protein n=1 Tax=Streptomyces sp. NPDC058257 TaxID=3346409 RepID=UPI0036EA0773